MYMYNNGLLHFHWQWVTGFLPQVSHGSRPLFVVTALTWCLASAGDVPPPPGRPQSGS